MKIYCYVFNQWVEDEDEETWHEHSCFLTNPLAYEDDYNSVGCRTVRCKICGAVLQYYKCSECPHHGIESD